MSDRIEIIVTSSGTGGRTSLLFLDPISGTELKNMQCQGEILANCLSFVGNDYLLYCDRNKPIIHSRMVNGGFSKPRSVHGCVSALAVSPNSRYCVYAVDSRIKVLSLESGNLTHIKDRHFHKIKFIKFTDDGSCFVTAGLDGLIIVWNLAYILSYEAEQLFTMVKYTQLEPVYVFTSHSLPVTDLCVGHGGMQAFIVSVSGDQTCKIHSLADGNLILSLVFKCALSAVTMSISESELFIGTVKGNIHKCNLSHMPRTRDYHMNEVDLAFVYEGHNSAINCLSTSLDGLHLLSGSNDGKIILWDIVSGQSVKVLKYPHAIVNAFYAICPQNIFLKSFEPSSAVLMDLNCTTSFYRKSGFQSLKNEDKGLLPDCSQINSNVEGEVGNSDSNSGFEYSRLRILNKQLFDFAAQEIFKREQSQDIELFPKSIEEELGLSDLEISYDIL